jgi:hypothetical protein
MTAIPTTTYSFDDTIPASNHSPSDDQPIMLINNESNLSIWNSDHIGFGSEGSGYHEQCTFLTQYSSGSAYPYTPAGEEGVMIPYAGTASTASDLYFVNPNGSFPMTILRSAGSFAAQSASGSITASSKVNVTSITSNSGGSYTIVFPSGIITSPTTAFAFISQNAAATTFSTRWSFSTNTLTISGAPTTGTIAFLAFQI